MIGPSAGWQSTSYASWRQCHRLLVHAVTSMRHEVSYSKHYWSAKPERSMCGIFIAPEEWISVIKLQCRLRKLRRQGPHRLAGCMVGNTRQSRLEPHLDWGLPRVTAWRGC